jgi:hypothetical protein
MDDFHSAITDTVKGGVGWKHRAICKQAVLKLSGKDAIPSGSSLFDQVMGLLLVV